MGWFKRILTGRKDREYLKDPKEPEVEVRTSSDNKKSTGMNIGTKTEFLTFIRDNCEQITENIKEINEAKVEYQAVSSYLTDMQKIDLIPKEQRENLEDAARRIMNLSKEREKYREKNTTITDMQYRLMERYEMQLPKDLEAIRESEDYQEVIEKDLEALEQERKKLLQEEKDIINKHSFLKGIAITTCILILLLFGVFTALSSVTGADFMMPFLLTILMGMVLALYIFLEARKNVHSVKLVELKQNRLISLVNKVKLKSVNNRNYLEYTFNKYMVDDYKQLKYCWEEFIKVKDEARRYKNNTELLEFYHNELIHELKKFNIADSEIWIYQPSAILDSREMVEVRHRLNIRRQKLRDRIELNNKLREEAVAQIDVLVKRNPEYEQDAINILKQYRLQQ